jgi:hypothetical protein
MGLISNFSKEELERIHWFLEELQEEYEDARQSGLWVIGLSFNGPFLEGG